MGANSRRLTARGLLLNWRAGGGGRRIERINAAHNGSGWRRRAGGPPLGRRGVLHNYGAGGGNRTLMRLDPAEFGKMGTGSVSQVTIRPD